MQEQPSDAAGTSCADGVPAALRHLREEVRELIGTLWAARTSDELMGALVEAEALKSTVDALVLAVVRELDATSAVKCVGWASTQDFVTSVAGGHKGAGHATVRLATAVNEPLFAPVGEAMTDGWLSIGQGPGHPPRHRCAARRPRHPVAWIQAMLDSAKGLDATDLRRVGRRLVETVDPDGQARREERELDREERAAHLGRNLSITFDGAGGCWIKGRCSGEDGAKLRATLLPLAKPRPAAGADCNTASCDAPGCTHDGQDPRDHGARLLDALIQLCDQAAAAALLPECHGVAPRVSVTIDLDDLKDESGYGHTETGEDLRAGTVRRMACDAEIIPVVLGSGSVVLDVGHAQRLVTPAIWRALVARDHHCRFPHCTRPPVMTHAHHIVHWADGGPTSLKNLTPLRPPPPADPRRPLDHPERRTQRVRFRPTTRRTPHHRHR